MTEKELITELINASPVVIGGIIMVIFLLRFSSIVEQMRKLIEAWNEGNKERSDAMASIQAQAIRAGTDAIEKAMQAMTRAMEESRRYHDQRLDDMRVGMNTLDARIHDLEADNEKLREEGRRKDERIRELESEVEQLRKRLDQRTSPKKGSSRESPKAIPSPAAAGA